MYDPVYVEQLIKENEILKSSIKEILDFPYVGAQASQRIRTIAQYALDRIHLTTLSL